MSDPKSFLAHFPFCAHAESFLRAQKANCVKNNDTMPLKKLSCYRKVSLILEILRKVSVNYKLTESSLNTPKGKYKNDFYRLVS